MHSLVILYSLLLWSWCTCIYLNRVAVVAAEIEVAEMLESPLDHVFGDSFISLPSDVFSRNNADAYGEGKLGC